VSAPTVVDLNADLGEAAGPEVDLEREVLPHVSTTHVACGFHAGDPPGIRATIEAAASLGVAVGAHPSYPDVEGFGRRPMARAIRDVAADVAYQVGALSALAALSGVRIVSVKPHGALYHRMELDEECAAAVARALLELDPDVRLVLSAGSAGLEAAAAAGIAVLAEAFCDRRYRADGRLADRRDTDALLLGPQAALEQALAIVREGRVPTVAGAVPIAADTLCVHGDTPGAPAIAAAVRRGIEEAGFVVRAPV
jgi:5-oxoprolinase (ATP-hydrolysing) subunit A